MTGQCLRRPTSPNAGEKGRLHQPILVVTRTTPPKLASMLPWRLSGCMMGHMWVRYAVLQTAMFSPNSFSEMASGIAVLYEFPVSKSDSKHIYFSDSWLQALTRHERFLQIFGAAISRATSCRALVFHGGNNPILLLSLWLTFLRNEATRAVHNIIISNGHDSVWIPDGKSHASIILLF